MAAHGLTIVRQCLRVIRDSTKSDSEVVSFINGALSAPGTCFTRGFDFDMWGGISAELIASEDGNGLDRKALQAKLEKAVCLHMWMDAYPTMEALDLAFHTFIRPKKPYWHVREHAIEKRDSEAMKKMREGIIPLGYPMDKRAPAVQF